MKTAAAPQRKASTSEAKGGGAARKPFFTQAKAREEEPQARMKVGRPGDRYELEADRVADQVVDGKGAGSGLAAGVTPLAQRAAEPEEETQAKAVEEEEVQNREEEKEVQAKTEEKEEVQARADPEKKEELQTKGDQPEEEQAQAREEEEELQARSSHAGTSPSAEIARQIRASRGGGNPLPGPLREKMEAQFGAKLDGVRIHTDAPAVLLSQALKAQAFTHGSDIFFNEGKFAPDSRSGQHLLAHELTHTIQQGAVQPEAQGGDKDVVSLAAAEDADSYQVRPEIVEAIRLARGEIGKVNAKKSGADGKRVGWERLREYFSTAFGGPVVSEQVIDRITTIEKTDKDGKKTRMDALPSWCGIFTWWAMKKAGLPIPDWKLGAPALDALKLRPAGELPRKGDIAIDVLPNNHFAMVTGLESRKDAEGKPLKLTRVATINGNTAGEDNLGGQVQERWHELEHWNHFLDPVGKLSLPEAPLVTVGREPEPIEAESAAPAAEAKVPQPAEDRGPTVESLDLESEVPAPPGDLMGETLPEPDLSLPPPADIGPAEEVAVIEKADLSGSSDEATTRFIDASPSAMAVTQPELGPAIDGKMKAEQQDIVDNPPVLEAKTSGSVDVPLASADQIPIPGDAQLGDGVQGSDPGNLQTVSEGTPLPFRGNAEREKELEEEDSGSFWDRFMNFLKKFIKGIRTKDDSIDTSAGDRPKVGLSGEADPGRMDTPREEGTTALKDQRDAQVTALRNNPGQANIQPRKLDEQRPVAVSPEAAATIDPQADDNVAAYAAAPLPQDVRDNADARIAKTLTPNLAEARSQTVDAATARDTDKDREIDTAQQAAAQLNADTDAAQRKLVIDNRGKVARLQGEGIGEAYDHVNAFSADAATEQGKARKEIGDHVKSEEGKAKTELDTGEKDAEKEKTEGERKAAEKKAELEKEQDKGSWWDRAKNAIKRAVKVITDAIDKVFTAVRNAVKTIIEKAKNAAIGLINAARDWVVDKLDKFRDWAKDKVNTYLKDTFPGLAKRINDGIDSVTDAAIDGVNSVADAAIEGITKLADSLAAALDKILSTFQTALKTAVRVAGAVLQGDFAEALRAAIEGACEIAGVDSKPVFEFFDRAGKAVMSILKDPVGFIRKLFGAVGDGIGNFFKHIKKHLIDGVVGWLTGALAEVNLSGPFEFSPRGILSIVLQVLGLTYANIKARVIRKVPAVAPVFELVEKGYELLLKVIDEGPGALWEEIKTQLSNLKETVMAAIRNWLIVTAIKEGIVWLLSLTNPASAIVKAIKLVFDLVMFLIERYQQIKDFILSVYAAVAEVAAGNFAKVTEAVENALARSVPVLISLFASVLGLGNIAKQVKSVITTITRPINKAIDWVVDKAVAIAKKVVSKIKAGAKKAKEKVKETARKLIDWWKARSGFKDDSGESHTLSYKGQKKSAKLYVASSNPLQIDVFLKQRQKEAKAGSPELALVTQAQTYYTTQVVPAEQALIAADAGSSTAKKTRGVEDNRKLADALQQHLDHMGTTYLRHMFGSGAKDFPPPKLPVMADNVKARSFSADYIVNAPGYKYPVHTGTSSTAHKGNLQGWTMIPKPLRENQTYVRMHLLPHKLGGDAVDSNLTPANGPKYNIPFGSSVERTAKQKAVEGPPAQIEPIWYSFTIGYHPLAGGGGESPWPSLLKAEWGTYEKRNPADKEWVRKSTPSGQKSESPAYPTFTAVTPDINDADTTAGEIADAADVDRGFAVLILNLRDALGGSFGTTQANFTRKMNDRYLNRATGDTRRGVENYEARLDKVKAAIKGGKLLLK
ncbi:eCIS core domain-containing protein [Pseudomonas jinjuensis]|uniref:eCIS core domain-containing protein n=1 Tax=Pseudomonas jinjuensis TaxID=198616 RepID=A0A1H0A2M7_9PSED|nr:DUF4157 domain-containing protein [Pseudomonas jinjuensis]SDN26936.1 protein of unknown function [Pseudomonas jinjuensis]